MDEEMVASDVPIEESPVVHRSTIRRSDTILKIAPDLVKFQAGIGIVKKNVDNAFLKSKYADLTAIWTEIRKPLAACNLAVIHGTKTIKRALTVTTLLIHTSGEWFEIEIQFDMEKVGPQVTGSLVTYGRRYGISALLNVVSEGEDDDGERALGRVDGKGKKLAAASPKTQTEKKKVGERKPWQWSKAGDPAPVYDKAKKAHICPKCSKVLKTDWDSDTFAAYISFCECRYAHNWEKETPEPFKSSELSDEAVKPKK